MSLSTAPLYDEQGARRGVATLRGRVVLDASSVPVVATSDSPKLCRFVMTRTGTGVYLITLQDKWLKLLGVNIVVEVAAVAAAAGREYHVSANNVAGAAQTLALTFVRTDSGAAADATASATFLVEITVSNAE